MLLKRMDRRTKRMSGHLFDACIVELAEGSCLGRAGGAGRAGWPERKTPGLVMKHAEDRLATWGDVFVVQPGVGLSVGIKSSDARDVGGGDGYPVLQVIAGKPGSEGRDELVGQGAEGCRGFVEFELS